MQQRIAFAVILILALAVGLLVFLNLPKSTITSIRVERPNLVIEGRQLTKVEVWAIPTGNNVTPEMYQRLGIAKYIETASGIEKWIFPIPREPMLVAQIFARGYSGINSIGDVYLSQNGATEIYDALWGP